MSEQSTISVFDAGYPSGRGVEIRPRECEPDDEIRLVRTTSVHRRYSQIVHWEGDARLAGLAISSEELSDRLRHSLLVISQTVEFTPLRRGGVAVLRGTRFPVARIIAELSNHDAVYEIADNYDLDPLLCKEFLEAVATQFERPVSQ
jgi:uncharacterized protein (DUF433 family)